MNNAKDTRDDTPSAATRRISYVFDSGFTPYISYAESFQAEAVAPTARAFSPATGKQYEVGVKYQPPGSDMLFTAAAYDLTRKDIVLSDTLGVSRPLGEAKVRGFELEATGDVNENLKLTAAYTYANSKMTKVTDPLDKNRPLPLTPENQAAAGLTTPGIPVCWTASASASACAMSAKPTTSPSAAWPSCAIRRMAIATPTPSMTRPFITTLAAWTTVLKGRQCRRQCQQRIRQGIHLDL